jgi:hypothetical protein
MPNMWTPAKKVWCCANAKKGCVVKKELCTLWGDPHVMPFDQPDTEKSKASSFYGDGDFTLVKSSTVTIQARFEGTEYTEQLAATNQIVVAGAFLKGHKIEVGTRESGILTVDGQAVIAGFPGVYHGAGFTVTYNRVGQVPDVIPEGNEKRVVRMDLPLGVTVTVFQWANYMDVEIEMPPQPGQDGVCGNANGNPGDDTTQAIMQRIGARVHPGESLLSGTPTIAWTTGMERMMLAECAASVRSSGHATCVGFLGPDAVNIVNACTFDMCFGMNVRARSHAKTYG